MRNFIKDGDTFTATPTADVAAGVGYLFGEALFGVALNDVKSGVPGEFRSEGIITLPKTSALEIAVGDRLFWDATNKVVNKTKTGQVCIGVATSAAANPSATVNVKLGAVTAAAA